MLTTFVDLPLLVHSGKEKIYLKPVKTGLLESCLTAPFDPLGGAQLTAFLDSIATLGYQYKGETWAGCPTLRQANVIFSGGQSEHQEF